MRPTARAAVCSRPFSKPGHLEVEALAEPAVAADEVLGGHEPVVERDLVGVHAAVAERVDRAAFDLAAAGPSSNANAWPGAGGFSTTNSDRPRWPGERSGSVRASSMSMSARPANVAHVFTPLTR